VSGRHGTPVDVFIDTAGVALAWALWARFGRSLPSRRFQTNERRP
jgi:hypothetical protein